MEKGYKMECLDLVSIIIPTHKGSNNICRAVDSVLAQTYKNLEVIIVDDNGRDTEEQVETQKRMKKYKDDLRVRYFIHKENKNGSAARNTGVRKANGVYIAFLDDDDEYTPDNIEMQLNVLNKLPDDYGATYCDMLQIRPGMQDEMIGSDKSGYILEEFAKRKVAIGTCVVLLKREVMDYLKEWDESFKRHQDWEFMLRFLERYKIAHIDNVGVVRYVTARHNAPNPDMLSEYRMHYLTKMKYIFEKFDNEIRKEIYDSHYSEIGKAYFKKGKLKKSIEWAGKTANPTKTVCGYFKDGFIYIKKRIKKSR